LSDLNLAVFQEVLGMFRDRPESHPPIVVLLLRRTISDTVILHSRETVLLRRWEVLTQISQIEIESNIAIKIAVTCVSGIALLPAPSLPRGMFVATESRQTTPSQNRSEHAAARARTRMQKAMRVRDKPAQLRFAQNRLQGFSVRAFGQPNPSWWASK